MQREQFVSYFFIGLFVFILYQLALIISPFFTAIFLAAILAFAFYPLYTLALKIRRVRSWLAALLTTLVVVLIVVLPATFLLISLMQEAVELYQRVSRSISAGELDLLVTNIRQALSTEWVQKLWTKWGPVEQNVTETVLRAARSIGNTSALQLAALTRNVFGWIFNFLLITILLFFFFRDGKYLHDMVFQLLPLSEKTKKTLSSKMSETFAAVIRGQLVTSMVQAILTGLTFWFLGLPLPFFFGFVAFLASMIPITGAATVWIPTTIYLFATQEISKAVALLVIGTFGISLSDNILKPILIGEKTKLPIVLLFLGILGGLNLYGFTGLFIGPVVIALFFVLLDIYQKEYQGTNTH